MKHHHRRRQRAAAATLATLGVLAIVVALRPEGGRGSSVARPTLVTPLLSARRAPGPVADAVGAVRLAARLDSIGTGLDACTVVVDADTTVVSARAEEVFIPASTLKLLTAAAAVDLLGPEARFTTRALVSGEAGAARALTLIGGGDPVLRSPAGLAAIASDPERRDGRSTELSALADRIVAAGVRDLSRGITVDDSRFDSVRYHPSWPDSYRAGGTVGPVGALVVDEGYADPATRRTVVTDPAIAAGGALASLLEDRGVRVGTVRRGRADPGATEIAQVASPTVATIAGDVLSASSNQGSEILLKAVAVHAGRPGTSADGAEVTVDRLRRLGVPTEGLVMVDGSGLSRENRASCATIEGAVRLGDAERLRVLRDGLAVAGRRGTLEDRLGGTALDGRVIAKTGTLDGVSGLAGTSTVRRPLRFALLVNGAFGESRAYALREAMAVAIAQFPDVTDGAASIPPPDPVPAEG